LPFSFDKPNENAIYESIASLLDKIIKSDLPTLGSFDSDTLNAVNRLLFAIAENDVTSFIKLEEKFNISRHTITSVFDALEKAEVLIKVPAYGANMTIAKKASKYLFMSPAIRMSFFYFTGNESTYNIRQGKLLEDSIGSHLYREFIIRGQGSIRYDSQEGGADFILQIQNNKQIIIEVGLGDKTARQIVNTAKKVDSNYNIIFSNSELKLDKENKILFVPLDYYFLV
jgi:predicted AAA+ superfamily ATPase